MATRVDDVLVQEGEAVQALNVTRGRDGLDARAGAPDRDRDRVENALGAKAFGLPHSAPDG